VIPKQTSHEWSLDSAVEQFFTENFNDGDLISWDWLHLTLEINDAAVRENQFILVERIEAFKTALLESHQVALQNVKGKGYRIVPPNEQAYYAASEAAKYLQKGLKKAGNLLTHTRQDQLNSQEKKRHTDTEVRIAALSGMVSKGKRDVFQLFHSKKKEKE
jgi:hypothetical protein